MNAMNKTIWHRTKTQVGFYTIPVTRQQKTGETIGYEEMH